MINEEAIRIVEEIEKLSEGGGEYDPVILQAICRSTYVLRVSLADDLPIRGKLSSIESWSTILFSARRHEDWGGPATIRTFILEDCAGLKQIIRSSEGKGENP